MTTPEALELLVQGQDLDASQARHLMLELIAGATPEALVGGVLAALRSKGASATELAAFATVLREEAVQLENSIPNLVDTCGTGGGSPTFNLSTAAAIVAAAAGAPIAKHGNRAVTSSCGSADVLEELGIRLDQTPEEQRCLLETAGIAFLFAPNHHPALKHIGSARRSLGIRTVFNQLGPLANPAGARRQLLGVYAPELVKPMAQALFLLGAHRALVVHGEDGMDEISPCSSTLYIKVWNGYMEEGRFAPADFGLSPLDAGHLAAGASAAENAQILVEAVSNPSSPRAEACLPSASAALWLAGTVESVREGAVAARDAIGSGAALRKLEEIRERSET